MSHNAAEQGADPPVTMSLEALADHTRALRLPFSLPLAMQQAATSSSLQESGAVLSPQSQLWQAAALRQQQLQLITHIASLNPFLQAAASSPPPAPQFLAQAATAAAAAAAAASVAQSNDRNLYRDYLAKFVQLQNPTTTSNNEEAQNTSRETKSCNVRQASQISLDPSISSSNKDTGNFSPLVKREGAANATQNGREKVFTCKICNRSFGYKHVLQNHERTHTGEKPFECKVCHKRFTRDHHLKTHMRLHTGEKPYSCSHCERQFVQVANLRRHLRVHTGEKPYKCELCESCFSDSNQLKAHALIHKGEKPFDCGECNGKFRRRHHLMHHSCPKQDMMMHDDESDKQRQRQRKAKEPKRLKQPDDQDVICNSEQTEPEDLSKKQHHSLQEQKKQLGGVDL